MYSTGMDTTTPRTQAELTAALRARVQGEQARLLAAAERDRRAAIADVKKVWESRRDAIRTLAEAKRVAEK